MHWKYVSMHVYQRYFRKEKRKKKKILLSYVDSRPNSYILWSQQKDWTYWTTFLLLRHICLILTLWNIETIDIQFITVLEIHVLWSSYLVYMIYHALREHINHLWFQKEFHKYYVNMYVKFHLMISILLWGFKMLKSISLQI